MHKALPEKVIAHWKAEDWDDQTMTASRYAYTDAQTGETGEPVELTEEEASRYTWGQTDDHGWGGSQAGRLMEL